jgi:hypothetical protein
MKNILIIIVLCFGGCKSINTEKLIVAERTITTQGELKYIKHP